MTIPDLINGLFELSGAAALTTNVAKLWKDKHIAGVHVAPTMFFWGWGFWNLFYYPNLHQWLSFCGGLAIVVVNGVWLCLAITYSRRDRLASRPVEAVPQGW